MSNSASGTIPVFIGTYTRRKSVGVYVYTLDLQTGKLEYHSELENIEQPSFLSLSPDGQHLYVINELVPNGQISACAIDAANGKLELLNMQSTGGSSPCYVTVHPNGRFAMASNYLTGSVTVLALEAGGHLGAVIDKKQHEGSSVPPERQQAPHAHSLLLDTGGTFACAPDLGIDKIMIYRFDRETGHLTPGDQPWVEAEPGVGPRHLTFHPNGRLAYLINEIGSTMSTFAYDGDGHFEQIQTLSTLPEDFDGINHTADVHVSPSGKHVYGSNRGHDSIVVFSIDEPTGMLERKQLASTKGRIPRNFAIDPTGALLLAANQETDSIVTFWRDDNTGLLTETGHAGEVSMPVCLKMIHTTS